MAFIIKILIKSLSNVFYLSITFTEDEIIGNMDYYNHGAMDFFYF